MTDKEKEYLRKRLDELTRKKVDLHLQIRKIDKEINAIMKKVDKEIISNE